MVLSWDPETIALPSGVTATEVTQLVCPVRVRSSMAGTDPAA
jgi:hypothetical protein